MKVGKKKEKTNIVSAMNNRWREMKFWENDNLCKLDWLLTGIILGVLFFTCIQGDLRLTGNRSFLMYEHFTDFYKASYEQSGGYYANYLPSTFIAYAIWNLPLYLAGHVPEAILTNSIINNMWYKLLPVLLYFATAHLIYKIGLEMGFGEKKARLCKFAFIVFPMGVFSQFIFSQYDIFTVFFIVLGLYFLLKGKMYGFAWMFGFAATFKYHAALYFLVLLVLKEKKIRNLIKYAVVMAAPFILEVVPNINSIHFQKNVFGFFALEFVQKQFNIGFFNGFNLLAAAAAFVLVWCYQKKTYTKEEFFSWAMFLANAMSFAIFGFSSWNPQWLLLMVPFLVLNIFINENGNMFMMITSIFMLALYIFSSQTMVGENVLFLGILKYILPESEFALRMWDVYWFHDEEMLCSALWVVLLCYAIFSHPKYHSRKGTVIGKGMVWQIRSAFLFGVAAFVLPLTVCVISMFQGNMVEFDNSLTDIEGNNTIEINEEVTVRQELELEGEELTDIKIRICNREEALSASINVRLIDKKTNEILYEGEKQAENFTNNSALYSFIDASVDVESGKTYILELSSDAPVGSGLGLYCKTVENETAELLETVEGKEGDYRLQMRVTGKR